MPQMQGILRASKKRVEHIKVNRMKITRAVVLVKIEEGTVHEAHIDTDTLMSFLRGYSAYKGGILPISRELVGVDLNDVEYKDTNAEKMNRFFGFTEQEQKDLAEVQEYNRRNNTSYDIYSFCEASKYIPNEQLEGFGRLKQIKKLYAEV